MASAAEPLSSSAFHSDLPGMSNPFAKSIPILPSSSAKSAEAPDEPMDMTPSPNPSMPPPAAAMANGADLSDSNPGAQDDPQQVGINGGGGHPVGAAAAAQQPKVVQTAFIHKLYNMLEDQSIQHLISWSSSNESFVMSPSTEFSKVLAQYFKHTNISSFVRQLNMYGFHKVSDVFHTGSPETPLWEFKHGAGSFKRGDLVGLREIKRRASRHTLINRESFANPPKMPALPQPNAPIEVPVQDPVEARLSMLEWNTHDVYGRLSRMEEAYTAVTAKCQALLEGLSKCHTWNQELCAHLLSLVPNPDDPVHKGVVATRQDVARNVEQLRMLSDPQENLFGNKQSFFPNAALPVEMSLPLSPRQRPFDESRRGSLQATPSIASAFRAPAAAQASLSPRRYGSIGAANGTYSPAFNRPNYLPPPPPPPAVQQNINSSNSPPLNLARRHTSADIRVHGWTGTGTGGGNTSQFNHGSSPYASGESSTVWPSSPRHAGHNNDHLRDVLAAYELPRATAHASGSRQASPPSSAPAHPAPDSTTAPSFHSSFNASYANSNDAGWQLPGARFPFKGLETPGTATRRSSMASNVHSLLNPADTAEREGEDDGPDERKRKRLQ